MAFRVTPWEVSGTIDYQKLIKQFGLQPIKQIPEELLAHPLFRRHIIYAHRDFDVICKALKAGKPFTMLTGLMPSGKFHFGHKLVADQMILYQKLGARICITVADVEAYHVRNLDFATQRKTATEEYLLNYVALGLDLDNCDFYFQSARSQDGKKANAYYRLSHVLASHATLNEFKAIYGDIYPGRISSALLQAADMLHPMLPEFNGKIPVVVPVGSDQDPHLRLARDLASRCKAFSFAPLASTYHLFLPGLKGGKMSSSDPTSFIALTESPEEAVRKVKKYAFSGGRETLEEHRKKGGNPDVDVAFQMLRYGLEPDDAELERIATAYRSGELLSSEMKHIACEKLGAFLRDHQKKREQYRKRIEAFVAKLLD